MKKGDDLSVEIERVLREYWNWDLEYDLQKTNHTPKTIIEQLFDQLLGVQSGDIPEDEEHSSCAEFQQGCKRQRELENIEGGDSSNASSLRRSVVLFCEARDEVRGGACRREILNLP